MSRETFDALCVAFIIFTCVGIAVQIASHVAKASSPMHRIARGYVLAHYALMWAILIIWAVTQ